MHKAFIIVGLGFGDCGKGTTTEAIAFKHKCSLVVRYNGGPQAAHNIVTGKGVHHTFHQFGSATFLRVPTYLSRFMMVEPHLLNGEALLLKEKGVDPWSLLRVDENSLLITSYHVSANKVHALGRGDTTSTTGHGIWETQRTFREFPDAVPKVGDLFHKGKLMEKLDFIQKLKIAETAEDAEKNKHAKNRWKTMEEPVAEVADQLIEAGKRIIIVHEGYLHDALKRGNVAFEGAQGVLLDENFGLHPYTTGSTTTTQNAEVLLKEAKYSGKVERVGVLRTYSTRHGRGVFPSESGELRLPEAHNEDGRLWVGEFRVGPLDLVLTKYALDVLGDVSFISLTHMDVEVPYICLDYNLSGIPEEERSAVFSSDSPARIRTRPIDDPDLDYQEKITRALEKVRPKIYPAHRQVIAAQIQDILGVPIGILSWGPQLCHKDYTFP